MTNENPSVMAFDISVFSQDRHSCKLLYVFPAPRKSHLNSRITIPLQPEFCRMFENKGRGGNGFHFFVICFPVILNPRFSRFDSGFVVLYVFPCDSFVSLSRTLRQSVFPYYFCSFLLVLLSLLLFTLICP